MDVRYINPFILAVKNVFDTMVKVPFAMGKPYVPDDRRNPGSFVVSVMIKLTGAVTGQFVMSMPEPVALALGGALEGAEVSNLADSMDALGEIASMIAGNAKKDLPGGQVSVSVPSVLESEKVAFSEEHPVIAIPCDTSKGRFLMEVSLV